jgi:hypothetical protein
MTVINQRAIIAGMRLRSPCLDRHAVTTQLIAVNVGSGMQCSLCSGELYFAAKRTKELVSDDAAL